MNNNGYKITKISIKNGKKYTKIEKFTISQNAEYRSFFAMLCGCIFK